MTHKCCLLFIYTCDTVQDKFIYWGRELQIEEKYKKKRKQNIMQNPEHSSGPLLYTIESVHIFQFYI